MKKIAYSFHIAPTIVCDDDDDHRYYNVHIDWLHKCV